MPIVNPETIIGDELPVPVIPPGEDVAVYPVIADPPVALAVNATFTEPSEETLSVTAPIVGAWGTVVIVIEDVGDVAVAFP